MSSPVGACEGRNRYAVARGRDDRGITLVLVALVLVVLIIFTAFAVDMGGVYGARRQDQTAADVAALAAAQDLRNGETAIVASAQQYADDSLTGSVQAGAWNSCSSDAGALSKQAVGANCISYDGSSVRVRLPDRFYPSVFGGVIGIDSYRHSAFAIAGLQGAGFGNVLPFFTTTSVAANGYDCLIAAGPGNCGPTTGSFFPLMFSYRTPNCDVGGSEAARKEMLENNAAAGIDHDIARYTGTLVLDRQCPPPASTPNATDNFTGNMPAETRAGLITGGLYRDGEPARLQRSAGVGPTLPRINSYGKNLDNTPLWTFISDNLAGPPSAPRSCQRDQFMNSAGDFYSNINANINLPVQVRTVLGALPAREQSLGLLVRCFKHYVGEAWDGFPGTLAIPEVSDCPASGCTGVVFGRNTTSEDPDLFDIQYSPRFGYSPVTNSIPSGGSGTIRFDSFRAIYLNRVNLGNTTGSQSSKWEAGFSPTDTSMPNNPNTSVEAFFFPAAMLPNGLGNPDAPTAIGVNRFVRLIR